MSHLFEKLKIQTRFLLLRLARELKKSSHSLPVIRESKSLFAKEIKIPVFVSSVCTVALIYLMLFIVFGITWRSMIATAIFVAVNVILFVVQIKNKERAIIRDNDAVVLMSFLFIIAVLICQLVKEYSSPFVTPVAAFSLMGAILLSQRIGVLYAVSLSLVVAFLNDVRFDIFLVILCSAIAVITNISSIRKRSDFINVGIKVSVVNVLIITMFYLFDTYGISQFEYNLIYGILNGSIVTVLLLVLMPLFEKLFSRTTNIKLIELSDFSNPLLKRLMLEAHGTYHHSIITADIAERAANVVNENVLLARVGAYYHDIGKLNNPQYFIENQTLGHNPHEALTPEMSKLILISHVKDGAFLARKSNIDNEIISIIQQHHGTTSMYSFYHRALEENTNVNIENFRYQGPKPQTKVAAIVMMADSCEAACRSIEEPTAARIKDMVEKIINNKFIDGQFSECPITLKDLELIKNSIISTVTGIYHARIEYK
ncbi:MAG: HDIG domain-containing protein [Endomicrobium sp.]|jgi:putative nucleotidyltransferase with HDIG domain|uniref:HD family phosphohydrolase n=1 Tax=Candidatus Endomicrobiellum cubanum TaxID=3242325 RepID=UPI00282843F9|nr:HDIG domain-containing protein [Endomicrobium sp.]MDR2395688.1 HDIG domain-containing protein [Endomicrobium sp.]